MGMMGQEGQGGSLECVSAGVAGAGPAVLGKLEADPSVETFSIVGSSLGVFEHDYVEMLSFLH